MNVCVHLYQRFHQRVFIPPLFGITKQFRLLVSLLGRKRRISAGAWSSQQQEPDSGFQQLDSTAGVWKQAGGGAD